MSNPINSYLDYTYLNSQHIDNFLVNLGDNGHFDEGFTNAAIDADYIISLGINPFATGEMMNFLTFLDENCVSLLDCDTDTVRANVRLAFEAVHSVNECDHPCHNIDEAIFNA